MNFSKPLHLAGSSLALALFAGSAAADLTAIRQNSPTAQPLDHIVAVVNDDVVLATELGRTMQMVQQRLQTQTGQLPPESALRKQVLDQLILLRLQIQRATKAGIRVDDDTLTDTVFGIAKRNGMDLRQFVSSLEAQGIPYNDFREEVRNELIMDQLRAREVEPRVIISDRELDMFLATQDTASGGAQDEYNISHILITLPSAPTPDQVSQSQGRAEQILAQLRSGADFAQVAATNSDGQRALKGGALGWRKTGELPSLFADAVRKLAPGQVTNLLRSPNGFHIVRLNDKRGQAQQMVTETLSSHILVRTNEIMNDNQARLRLGELRRRALRGESFSALAQQYSDDTASGRKGGDLGWQPRGRFDPVFQGVLDSLSQAGEISEPFKSRFGWHVVKLEGRRDKDGTEQIRRNKARAQIRQRKMEEETLLWLRHLREEAYVEIRDSKS